MFSLRKREPLALRLPLHPPQQEVRSLLVGPVVQSTLGTDILEAGCPCQGPQRSAVARDQVVVDAAHAVLLLCVIRLFPSLCTRCEGGPHRKAGTRSEPLPNSAWPAEQLVAALGVPTSRPELASSTALLQRSSLAPFRALDMPSPSRGCPQSPRLRRPPLKDKRKALASLRLTPARLPIWDVLQCPGSSQSAELGTPAPPSHRLRRL